MDAKKYDNNVAFPKGRLWRAHCVEISEGHKIAKACKGLKPLVIRIYSSILYGLLRFTRNDDNKEFKNFDNNVTFPKGRLWRAHCVEISEGRKIVKGHKGLKPLVIRNLDAEKYDNNVAFPKNAENHNNNAASAHCVQVVKACKKIKNQFGIMSLSDYGSCYKNYSTERNENFRNNCDFKNHNSNFCFDGDKIYNLSRNLSDFLFNKKIFKKIKIKERKNEKDFSNCRSFNNYGNASIRYVWS